MKGLIKLGLFVVVVYLAVSYGKPWLERMSGTDFGLGTMGGTDIGTAERCVSMVERANQDFAERTRAVFYPSVNAAAWPPVHEAVQNRLDKARNDCGCFELTSEDSREGCQAAQEALGVLERMVAEIDGSIRGGGGIGNPAYRQEQINALLTSARRAVPKG
ncbi:MAG TPA: hypothetical protein VMV46_12285 [Thermoanaerobaculia bacterium]|nr:hypothetical protein [Thermoanaerobaculia bacterium]